MRYGKRGADGNPFPRCLKKNGAEKHEKFRDTGDRFRKRFEI